MPLNKYCNDTITFIRNLISNAENMIDRRKFLRYTAGLFTFGSSTLGATALLLPSRALASSASVSERKLKFLHLHTGETLNTTYWAEGHYIAEELNRISYVLRDFRSGDIKAMDKNLLDVLYLLQQRVAKSGPYHVISAYRSPKTNAALRRRSKGVAKHSMHLQGKAIDIRLPGIELTQLRRAALSLRAGGVGYYPKSNFIHVDTGRVRYW
jgi:uncharacterized protein YcbK (DUF882 family)